MPSCIETIVPPERVASIAETMIGSRGYFFATYQRGKTQDPLRLLGEYLRERLIEAASGGAEVINTFPEYSVAQEINIYNYISFARMYHAHN